MLDWSSLNPATFEALALEYARITYPGYEWVLTPRSNDGNRDVVAEQKYESFGEMLTQQYWVEAKFSKDAKKLRKDKLDSTLVSGFLAGNVRKIIFITNGPIRASTITRANQFDEPFRNLYRDGRPKLVTFVYGEVLEHWFAEHPVVYAQYFGGTTVIPRRLERPSIGAFLLFRLSDYRRGIHKSVTGLTLGDDYVALLQILSPTSMRVRLDLQQLPVKLLPESGLSAGGTVELVEGHNAFLFRAMPAEVGERRGAAIRLRLPDPQTEAVVFDLPRMVVTRRFSPVFIYRQQSELASELLRRTTAAIRDRTGLILLIRAEGGIGKSYALELLERDLPLGCDFLRIACTERGDHNAKLLCEFLLFANFGLARTAPIDQILSDYRGVPLFSRDELHQLIEGTRDGRIAQSILSQLTRRGMNDYLVTPVTFGDARIATLDDCHKLSGDGAQVLSRCLRDLRETSNNTVVIAAARPEEFASEQLRATLATVSDWSASLEQMTREQIDANFKKLFELPFGLPNPVLEMLEPSTLLVRLFMRDFAAVLPRVRSEIDMTVHAANVLRGIQADAGFLRRKLERPPDEQRLLDIVCAVESGIEHLYLKEAFGNEMTNRLLDAQVIREYGDLIRPYHDILAAEYRRMRENVFTEDVGIFLEQFVGRSVHDEDILSTLLRCGARFQATYLESSLSRARVLVGEKSYGSALPILQSVFSIVRKRGFEASGLKLHDIVETMFNLAVCIDHCRSTEEARALFEEVAEAGERLIEDPGERGIAYEAEAESFNAAFWLLDTSGLLRRIDAFLNRMSARARSFPRLAAQDRYKRAYLTALNRRMMTLFLLDRNEEAQACFRANLVRSRAFEKANYEGYAKADFAKSMCAIDPAESRRWMTEAVETFEKLGDQKRRLVLSRCELAFIEHLLVPHGVEDLVQASALIGREGYFQEHQKSFLKIAACLVRIGDADMALEFAGKTLDVNADEIKPRVFALYNNVMAGISALRGDIAGMVEYSRRQLEHLCGAGDSYKAVALNNVGAIDVSAVSWSHERTGVGFVLDSRYW
ncbi:MAG: restriction endonuclease [Thermoanaerobaculia bacterium]